MDLTLVRIPIWTLIISPIPLHFWISITSSGVLIIMLKFNFDFQQFMKLEPNPQINIASSQ